VPNAVVNVMNDSSVVKRATVTNDVGEFALAVIPPGRYQLEVQGPGFAVHHQRINILGSADSLPPLSVVLTSLAGHGAHDGRLPEGERHE